MYIAKASCGEVRAQMIFANEREYLTEKDFEKISKNLISLGNQIGGVIKYLRNSEIKGFKFTK